MLGTKLSAESAKDTMIIDKLNKPNKDGESLGGDKQIDYCAVRIINRQKLSSLKRGELLW